MIVDATLNLRQVKHQNNWLDFTGNCDSIKIAVREVTSSWAENTLTWNNQPTVSSTVIDYRTVTPADTTATSGAMYYFNITSLIQKWYNDSASNYGVAVYPINEQTTSSDPHAFTCFYSKNNPYANNQTIPFFTITYRNTAGLEDYYTYHTHGFDSVTGFINDYTGNLVVVQDLGLEIENFPLDLALVYNSVFANTDQMFAHGYNIFCGKGWQYSFAPALNSKGSSFVNGQTFELFDGDGTSHYFSYSADEGCYVDEGGLGYTLTQTVHNNSTCYVLDTGDGWKYYFKPDLLDTIEYYEGENEPAVYTFTYTYDNGKITGITSGNNTVLSINYSVVAPTSITAGTKTVSLSGAPSKIDSVTTPDGQYSYAYDNTTELMTSVENDSGKEYRYTYNNASKVSFVTEYYDGNAGDSVYISYSNRQTVYRTRGTDDTFAIPYDDIMTTYQFDTFGRVTNVYSKFVYGSEIVSAIGVDYYGDGLFSHGENNVKSIYRNGYGTVNMLRNPSAELSGTQYWSNINGITGNGVNSAYGNSFAGLNTFKLVYDGADYPYQGFEQAVTLSSGNTYTLSAYVKTQNASGSGGAIIGFRDNNANELNRNILAKSEYIKGTTATDILNGWRRIVVQYTPSSTGTYYAYIGAYGCTDGSIIYYDAVQLEESTSLGGSSFSDYNYIRNAGFEDGTYSWYNCNTAGEISSMSLFGSKSQKISGNETGERRVIQYSEPIPAGQPFVLSGWAKANSVALNEEGRTFEIMAELEYEDIMTEPEKFHVSFNPNIADWQYATMSFTPPRTDVRYYVTVYLCYDHNCNDAYFDNISLTLGGVVSFEDASSSGEGGEGGEDGGDDGELHEIDATHKYQEIDGIRYTYTYDSEERIIETVVENVSGSGSADKFYTATNYYTDPNNSDLEVTEEIDERGISTKYKYLNDKLHELIDGKGHTTSYTYNADDLLTKLSQTIGTLEISNNYTYSSNGDLTGIAHKEGTTTTQVYSFAYDVYGNLTSISQGNTALVTYAYNPNNGKLISATYANGFVEGYGYDAVDNLSTIKYNSAVKFKYLYDRDNVLQYTVDYVNGTTERYEYDINGTLIRSVKYNTSTQAIQLITEYVYSDGALTGYRYIDGSGNASYYGYTYDDDGQISRVTLPSGASARYYYDKFGRITDYGIYNSSGNHVTSEWYTYLPGNGGSNASTHLIGTIDYADYTWFDYTYDNNGNILTVKYNNSSFTATNTTIWISLFVKTTIQVATLTFTHTITAEISKASILGRI